MFSLVSVLVLKGKPKENYWKTNPSRLRDLSGDSFWVSLYSVFSLSLVLERGEYTVWAALDMLWASPFSVSPTQPALGLLVRDFRLASFGLFWLALALSFASLSSFTRNK